MRWHGTRPPWARRYRAAHRAGALPRGTLTGRAGPPAHRGGQLAHTRGRLGRPAADGVLGRPRRGPWHRHGRAGPVGVSLPCPSALGATWDPGLVGEVAAALGAEARGKGIDVLLAPTIHLMRTPLGGRGFECFAEDPVLTARIAVAYVRGVQSAGVAVRGQALHVQRLRDAALDLRRPGGAEHVLRELYLVPFESGTSGRPGALAVMAGYNSVWNGATMYWARPAADRRPQGRVVVQRRGGVGLARRPQHRETAAAGLDLAMPGPSGPGARLAAAVPDPADRRRPRGRQGPAGTAPGQPGRRAGRRVDAPGGARRARGTAPARDGRAGSLADPALLRRAAAAAFTCSATRVGCSPSTRAPLGSAGRHRPERAGTP